MAEMHINIDLLSLVLYNYKLKLQSGITINIRDTI